MAPRDPDYGSNPPSNFTYNSGNPMATETTAPPVSQVYGGGLGPAYTGNQFIGPIPIGTTRTQTGYKTDSSATADKPTTTGMTAAEVQAMLDAQAAQMQAQFQAQIDAANAANAQAMAGIQSGIAQQIQAAQAASEAAAKQAKIDATNAQRKSAFEITKERFAQAGLKELGDEIVKIYQGTGVDRFGKTLDEIPTSSEGFYLALINTKAYYDRFGKVNEDRLANGFKALDEKTIVGMEDEYQKTMQAYNVPAGYYDQATDFQVFLKNNYNVTDVANTMQAYSDFVKSTDPAIRGQLKELYGIGDEALTAYFADPTKGQPILESIAGKNMNTAAALLEGLTTEQAGIGQQYGAGNLTYGQQRQSYSKVKKDLATTGALAQIYGENYGAQEAISAEFGGDVASQMQAARIQSIGAAAFGGTSGIGRSALGTKTTGVI